MQAYRHWQAGTLILAALGCAAVAMLAGALASPELFWFLLAGCALMVCFGFFFHGMTVTVDEDKVRVSFGPGWPATKVALAQIHNARIVTNRWWMGWGIHYIGRGWLWNCAGWEAVELDLDDDKRIRIGTDDPEGLLVAVRRALEERAHFSDK